LTHSQAEIQDSSHFRTLIKISKAENEKNYVIITKKDNYLKIFFNFNAKFLKK